METEIDPDDRAIILGEVDARFSVRDEKSAAWVVRKIIEERTHRQRVADWYEAETRRSERREQFLLYRFGSELSNWTRRQLEQHNGKRRSIHLPSGVVGFRTEPNRIVVTDERKLLDWCQKHLRSAVKVVESVLKSEISAHLKQTGECPDGAQRPELRLKGVRPMTSTEQQRFEMLFDALIARWLARNDAKEGETHV